MTNRPLKESTLLREEIRDYIYFHGPKGIEEILFWVGESTQEMATTAGKVVARGLVDKVTNEIKRMLD